VTAACEFVLSGWHDKSQNVAYANNITNMYYSPRNIFFINPIYLFVSSWLLQEAIIHLKA